MSAEEAAVAAALIAGGFTLLGVFVTVGVQRQMLDVEAQRSGRAALGQLLLELDAAESVAKGLKGNERIIPIAVDDDQLPDFSVLDKRFDDLAVVIPMRKLVQTAGLLKTIPPILRSQNKLIRQEAERFKTHEPDPLTDQTFDSIIEELNETSARAYAWHALADSNRLNPLHLPRRLMARRSLP